MQRKTNWTPKQGQKYKIVSALDKKMVLDVSKYRFDENNMIIFKWNNSSNQIFHFQSIGNNKFQIISDQDNRRISVFNNNKQKGTRITINQNDSISTQFKLIPADFNGKANTFYIQSFSGFILDVKKSKCEIKSHVIQWAFHGGKNQIWSIYNV